MIKQQSCHNINKKKEEEPLISILIPTLNEEITLPLTLERIKNQTYKKIETIVIDSHSKDRTTEIAKNFGTIVLKYEGKPLGARRLGLQYCKGEYILLLDADQLLEKDTLERAIKEINSYDMLILGEHSYNPTTFTQRQISKERYYLNNENIMMDPINGGLRPRFFKKEFLTNVYDQIPKELYEIIFAHDDSIIYYEAYKISKKVNILPSALYHTEEKNLFDFIVHNYKFGKNTKILSKTGLYKQFYSTPLKINNVRHAMKANNFLLAAIRKIAFQLGYFIG